MIVRYKNMTGYKAPYIPGWDTHGLPIESAILKNKKIKRDELSDVEFRDKCREYALSFVDRQRSEFQRLGVIGDWDNPYLTLKPEFEAAQIRVFGKMAEKGYIYKGTEARILVLHRRDRAGRGRDRVCRTIPAPPFSSSSRSRTTRASWLPVHRPEQDLFRDLDHHRMDPARQLCHLP